MEVYKVIIVDDHELFRKGMKMIIRDMQEFEVTAEAEDGEKFLQLLENHKPDLVLMDLSMPRINGIEAAQAAKSIYPEIKVIALTMHGESEYFNMMMEAGVKGFIMKDSDTDELKIAMKKVVEGKTYYSQELLMNCLNREAETPNNKDLNCLSDREKEIIQHLCLGHSNAEIAEKLFISPRTVESHRANILSKINVKNTIQLVVFAIKNGLFKP